MNGRDHWLVRPRTIRLLWWIFGALLALTLAAELGIQHESAFAVERVFGFNVLFGFAACAALIVVARLVGLALKRPDAYYEPDDE